MCLISSIICCILPFSEREKSENTNISLEITEVKFIWPKLMIKKFTPFLAIFSTFKLQNGHIFCMFKLDVSSNWLFDIFDIPFYLY